MATVSTTVSAPAALAPDSRARIQAALAIMVAFLALEPLVRSVSWWLSGGATRGLLHADARLFVIAVIAAAGSAVLPQIRALLRHRWLLWAGAAWLVAAVASSWMALAPDLAASHSAWWAMYLLSGLYLLAMLRERSEVGQTVLLAWCIGFCGYALVVITFIVADPARSDVEWVWEMPGVANIRHLGFEAAAAALVGSVWRPANLQLPSVWLLRTTAVLGWGIMFWSGGRGHLVAAVIALACVFALTGSQGRGRRAGRWIVLAVAGFAVATLHTPPVGSLGAWRTIGFTTHSVIASNGDPTSGRIDMWRETLSLIEANPVFGVGEGQAMLLLKTAGGTFAQPHNLILQAGMAWGIVGGGAFLAAIGFVMLRAARRLRGASLESPAAAGLAVALAMVANSMLDASMFHPRPIMLFMIGACLALAASTARVESARRSVDRS